MKSKQGNILVIILAIIALLSLSIAGYFFWQNQRLQDKKSNGEAANKETENWQKFTSKDPRGGYEISYPSDWVMERGEGCGPFFHPSNESFPNLPFWITVCGGWDMNIRGESKRMANSPNSQIIEANRNETINGIPVITQLIKSKSSGLYELETYFQDGDNIHIAYLFSRNLDLVLKNRSLYQNFLSTFKLLGNSSSTVDWETYDDEIMGISFKYPGTWSVSCQAPGSDYYCLLKLDQTIVGVITEGLRDPNAHSVKLSGIDNAEKLKPAISYLDIRAIIEQKIININSYQALHRIAEDYTVPGKTVETYILDGKGKVIIIKTDAGISQQLLDTREKIVSTIYFL